MAVDGHHHRSTTKVNQKSFKTRHASKSFLRDQAKGSFVALLAMPALTVLQGR
jgi:pre-rRNA-processing protein TSR1